MYALAGMCCKCMHISLAVQGTGLDADNLHTHTHEKKTIQLFGYSNPIMCAVCFQLAKTAKKAEQDERTATSQSESRRVRKRMRQR